MATRTITRLVDANGDEFVFTDPDVSDKLNKNGDGKDVTVTFTAATTRTNVTSGNTLATLFGRVAKWFTDLKALAFKDKVGTGDVSSGTYAIDISGNAASATNASFATTAGTAAQLNTARSIHVNLESNSGAAFNGTANVEPGVKGVLPTAFGGTGFSTVDTAPTKSSNKMVTSGGVFNYAAPAALGILTGDTVNVTNSYDQYDRFAVIVTEAVRLRTYWLQVKNAHVIEFYNLNDYEIPINVVLEIGNKVVFHRQSASDVTWTNSGSTTSAQTLCRLSHKGYVKFFVTYNSNSDQYDIYQNSDFEFLTGTMRTAMIGSVGTASSTSDTKTDVIYQGDIVCNNGSTAYNINIARLAIGKAYRFQVMKDNQAKTFLYNYGSSGLGTVKIYSGNSSFNVTSNANFSLYDGTGSISHTVTVIRMTSTNVYVIWGY